MSTPTAPVRSTPIDPFSAGMLVAGIVVGLPLSVALGIAAGQVARALLVPALAVAITSWLWHRANAGGARVGRPVLVVRPGDAVRFAAGAVVSVLALAAVFGGAW